MLWPEGQGPWWQKAIAGYGLYILIMGAVVTFIVIGNRKTRRSARKQ